MVISLITQELNRNIVKFKNMHLSYLGSMKENNTADLVAFTEEILNGKLHFCAV